MTSEEIDLGESSSLISANAYTVSSVNHKKPFLSFFTSATIFLLCCSSVLLLVVYSGLYNHQSGPIVLDSVISGPSYRACVTNFELDDIINFDRKPGCVYLLDKPLPDKPDGSWSDESSKITTICGCQSDPIKLDINDLSALGMVDESGNSLISFLIVPLSICVLDF